MTASPDRVDAQYAGIAVRKDRLEAAVCGGDGTLAGAPPTCPWCGRWTRPRARWPW